MFTGNSDKAHPLVGCEGTYQENQARLLWVSFLLCECDEKKEEEEKKEDATVTVILSNHLSLPSDYSSSKSKIVLKRLDDQSTTVLHTPTNKSIEMIVNFGKEKKSRMFEIINDTPSGSEYFYCHYYCCYC